MIRPVEPDVEFVRILICEPQSEVRALLAYVERLGHEPVFPADPKGNDLPSADIILLEPADPDARATAEALLWGSGGIPVVCTSIYPDFGQAGSRPLAYLVKPFGLAELERALTAAVERVANSRSAPAGRLTTTSCSASSSRSAVSQSPASRRSGDTEIYLVLPRPLLQDG